MSSADVSSNVLHSHKDKLINVLVSGQYVNQIIPSKNINDLPVIKPIFLWYDKKFQSLVWEPKNLNQQRQINKECNIIVSNIKDCVVSQPIHNLDENLKSLCVTIVYTNNTSDTNNLLQTTFQCNDTTQIKIIILALRLILLDNKSSSASEQTVPSNDTKTTESTSTSSSSAAPAAVTTKTSTEPLLLSLPEPDTRQLKNQFPMLKTVLNKLQPKKIIRALADYLSAGYTINNPLIDALITIEIEPIFTYFYNSGLPIIRFIPNSATFEQTTLYFYPDDARGVLYWGSFRSPQGVIRLHEVTEITSGKSSSSSLNLDKYNEILSGYELTKRLALTTVTVPINGIVEKEKIITSTFYIIDASFPLLQLFILMITRLLCDPQTSQKMRVIYGKQSTKSSSTTTPTSSSTATSSSTTAKSKTKNVATQSPSNYVDNLPSRFHDIQPLKNSSTYQSLPDHMGWLLDSFASLSLNEQPSSSSSSSEITDDALSSSSSASLSIAVPSSQFQSSLMFSPAKKTRSKIFQDDEPSKQQQQQQHQLQQQQQQPVVTADDEANHQNSIISTDTLPVSIMSADISELLTNPAIITALDDLHRTAQNQRKLHYNTLQQRHTIAGVSSYPSSSSTSTTAATTSSSSIALASAAEAEFIAKPNDKTHTAIPTTTLHGPSPVRQKINSATTQSFQTLNKSSQSANEMSQEKQKMIDQQLYIEQLQHQLLVSSQQLEEHRQKELDIQEKNKKCLDEIFQKIETPQKEQKKATKLMSELHSSIQKAQSQYNTLHEQFADGLAPFDLSDSEEESEESDSAHDSKNKVIPNAFQLNRVHRSGDSGDVADDDDDDCLILDDSLMTDNDNDNQNDQSSNNDLSNDNHIQNAMIGLGSSQQVSPSSPSGIKLQNNSLNNSKRISKAQTRRLVENSMRGLDKSSVASLEQYLDKSTRDSLNMFHSSQNNSNHNNNNNNANNGNDDVNTHKSHHEMLQLRNPKLRQKLTTATYNRQDKTKINQPSKATSPVLSTASAGSSTTTRKPSDINALPTYKQTGLVDISGVLHEEPKYQKTQLPTTRQKRVSYPISHNELNTSFFSTNGSTSSSTNSLATKPLVNKKPTAVKPPISHNNPINRPNKPLVGAHGSTTQQTTAAVVTGTKIANNTTTTTPSTTTSSSTQISPPTASGSSQPSTKLTANRSASNTAANSKSSIGAAPIATSTKVPSSRSQIGSTTATSTATRTLPRSGVASKSSINEPIKPKSTTSATSSATASRIGATRSGVNNGGIPRRNPSSSTTTSSSSSTAARK